MNPLRKETSIKTSFFMNGILMATSVLFSLLTFPYVSRILGPAGMGKVGFASSVAAYFNLFAQLGIPTYGIRICAKLRDDKMELSRVTQELTIINLLMGLLSYACLAAALLLIPRLRGERSLYLIMSTSIALNAIGMEWLYKGLEQYSFLAIRSAFFRFLALLGIYALVQREDQYTLYGALTVLASSAGAVWNVIGASRLIQLSPVGNYQYRRHVRPILLFFNDTATTEIYTNLDTLMLGVLRDDAAVGYYSVAVKIKGVLVMAVASVGTVLLPRASYYYEKGKRGEFWNIGKTALHAVLLSASALSVYFILFARPMLLLFSGTPFLPSVRPMQIIMPTLFCIGLTNVMGVQILIPQGREHVVLRSELCGAVTDFVLNLILIPRFSASGAALGTSVAELAVLLVQFHALRRELLPFFCRFSWWKLGTALMLSGGLSLVAQPANWPLPASIALSLVVFFGTCLFSLLLLRESLILEATKKVVNFLNKI